MAPRTARLAAQPPLWQLIEQLDAELQHAVLELIGAAGIQILRLAFRAARTLANGRVERIRLHAEDLCNLHLRARFPRLQRLELAPGPDGDPRDAAFADFAAAELAHLYELDLTDCQYLGAASVAAVLRCCPQLRRLELEGTGGPAR